MTDDIDLNILARSFERVGKRYLDEEELRDFVMKVLKYETKNLMERTEMYERGEIEENEINDFDFYTDGYRSGVLIHLTDDNVLIAGYGEDGKPVEAKMLYKKNKDGSYAVDKNGNRVPLNRVLMRFKSRRGSMGTFMGIKKFEYLEKKGLYVFVGQVNEQWKNLTTNQYESFKREGFEYGKFPTYTLNVFQVAKISKQGKKINIDLPDFNFEREENGGGFPW